MTDGITEREILDFLKHRAGLCEIDPRKKPVYYVDIVNLLLEHNLLRPDPSPMQELQNQLALFYEDTSDGSDVAEAALSLMNWLDTRRDELRDVRKAKGHKNIVAWNDRMAGAIDKLLEGLE